MCSVYSGDFLGKTLKGSYGFLASARQRAYPLAAKVMHSYPIGMQLVEHQAQSKPQGVRDDGGGTRPRPPFRYSSVSLNQSLKENTLSATR